MKVILKFLSVLLFVLFPTSSNCHGERIPLKLLNENETLELSARSAVLMEPSSGQILYQKDPSVRLYPASMTKMMGMILVLESIDSGLLKWEDKVVVSETAKSMGGTQIYLEPNEEMSVNDLFKSVAIASANDAIVALGEKVSGSLPSFVNAMNIRAKELEMNDTHFNNATGFDDPSHYTSALDMAKCARELVKHGEDIFRFTRLKEGYVREETTNPFWLVNTNKMLGSYSGMDGLKTGYTNLAGYNLTATASRNGIRLISVVMKEDSIKNRASDTTKLLDYGFSKLDKVELFSYDTEVAEYTFNKTLCGPVKLYLGQEVAPITLKGATSSDYDYYIEMNKVTAPIESGEKVGDLVVTNNKNGVTTKYDVVVKEDIPSFTFFDYWLYNISNLFA